MKPFFFGNSQRRLFGVYSAPFAGVARDAGVLICYPGVHEYNISHWACRRLSAMLAREGFHVLRFDWSGTGDSSGDLRTARIADWIDEVAIGAAELRALSSASSLSVVGMRLGAAIAGLSCKGPLEVDDLVLWEPVVHGRVYVEEIEALDGERNLQLMHRVLEPRDELMGFPFPRTLRAELEEVEVERAAPFRAKRIGIFGSQPREDYPALCNSLVAGGADASYTHVNENASIRDAGARESALLSNEILRAITARLARGGES